MSGPMKGVDRIVLVALQALVLALPLFLGGRQTLVSAASGAIVLALLVVTMIERKRREQGPEASVLLALAAFLLLGVLTTVPLPPKVLEWISPATARLYAEALPGWPGEGGWTVWRPLAISPWDVMSTLGRISIGLGAFAVIVAFPWRTRPGEEEDARSWVLGRLVATVLAGGVLVAVLGLVQLAAGNGFVMWLSEELAEDRASGPFVNPNHYAAWLEMVIPVALAYGIALAERLRRKISATAKAGRRMGVRARRAWVSALVTHQQRLWPPLLAAVLLLVMIFAHAASESRGGQAALLVGLGVAAAGMAGRAAQSSSRHRVWRAVSVAGGALLILGAIGSMLVWARAQSDVAASDLSAAGDMSLGARLAAASLGSGIVRDFPLFGTGLGSWLHAFRPYQAPPLETGILDHAHNDYLELTAETGLVGIALVALFVFAVVRTVRRSREESTALERQERRHGEHRPFGFEVSEWRLALRQHHLFRWGLAGGVAAILVHSLVDFGLRMPANLLLLMVLLGAVVLAAGPARTGRAPALAVIVGVLALVVSTQAANWLRLGGEAPPLSPEDSVERAELLMAEEGDVDRGVVLARHAIDASPAYREAHEMMADVLGPGPEGTAALRRALELHPWSVELRDRLGLRLWGEGQHAEGAAELEESMRRYPWFPAHTYLTYEDATPTEPSAEETIRSLTDPDPLHVRLTNLDPQMAAAIESGLRRALGETLGGSLRSEIVDQLALLLERRERWSEAGALLQAEAELSDEPSHLLTRASKDFLRADDDAAAEKVLLAALLHTPDQGTLYQRLAVDVYAPRGQFDTASMVLAAAQRNAIDLMPVYEGVTEVLSRRRVAERSQQVSVDAWAAEGAARLAASRAQETAP